MGPQKSQLLWCGYFNRPMSKQYTFKATPSTIWCVLNWTGAVSPTPVCVLLTYCYTSKDSMFWELRLCWAVIAPYIWVSPRQATSQRYKSLFKRYINMAWGLMQWKIFNVKQYIMQHRHSLDYVSWLLVFQYEASAPAVDYYEKINSQINGVPRVQTVIDEYRQ